MVYPRLEGLFVMYLRTGDRHLVEDVHLLVARCQFMGLLVAQDEECDGLHNWFDDGDCPGVMRCLIVWTLTMAMTRP